MKEVDIISKVVGRDTSGKAAMYIPGAGAPSVDLDDYLLKKIWDSVFEIRTDGEGNPYLFEKMPFVTQYGITMYADGGELELPSIYAGLPIDNQTLYWENGVLKAKGGTEGAITSITSTMVVDALGYTPAKASDIPSLSGYATETYVEDRIDDLINGAPAAYDTLKEIADVLAGNVNSIGDIITTLETKADKATTLAGYGITDAYTKTKVDELLSLYVTIKTAQTITGEKNFTGGLKVNGSPIVYDATKKYWKLEGDLLVTGGVTMFASDSDFVPSTIMDAIATDGTNLKVVNGVLTFVGSIDGGEAGSVAWENVTGKPSFASVATSGKYSDLSGTPTLLSSFTNDVGFITSYVDTKNTAGSTNTSSKIFLIGATSQAANPQTYSHDTAYVGTDGYLYSGGAKVLTSHQTIYNLTMQAGAFSAVTFDPNGANKTVNIPTTTSHITEGDNLYYTNARAQAAITGGASTIVTSNLTANRALISNASGKVAVSAVTSTELGYLDGVTSAIQTQLNSKLAATSYTAADVLAKLLTVDGASSGLDADLLDGTHKSGLLTAASSSSATNLSITVGGTTKTITDLYAYKTTQLETARTIWGQSFDGTANVSGALSGATTGAFSSNVTIGGTLGVNGAATLKSTLSVASDTTLATKLTLNGIPIYKSQDDVLYIDGNLAVRGGITMYATDAIDVPSIIDALPIASASAKGIAAFNPNDFSVVDGYVSFIGNTGVDESVLADYAKKTDLSAYLPLSGGQMTGGIGYTLTPDSYQIGLPAVGTFDYTGSLVTEGVLAGRRTFIGSVYNMSSGYFDNVISIRHRNGLGDGSKYGMYINTNMTITSDSLKWNRQINGSWQGERVILDSVNWSQYISAGQIGAYLPLSGGTLTGRLNVYGTLNAGQNINGTATIDAFNGMAYYGCDAVNNGQVISSTSAFIAIKGSTGFIAMGHNNPLYKLDVAASTNQIMRVISVSNAEASVRYTNNSDKTWVAGIGCAGIGDGFGIYSYTYGKNALYCDNTGMTVIAQTTSIGIKGIAFNRNIHSGGIFDTSTIGIQMHIEDGGLLVNHFNTNDKGTRVALFAIDGILSYGGITMYSDIRKKTKLQDVELSLRQIANAPLIEHYYNSDDKRTTHVGSIAQYWAGLNDWFCKKDSEGFYTMEIQNAALASAISIARELVKYESKTDRKIRLLKDEVKRLKKEIKILKSA